MAGSKELEGRTALVTGGARGIGRATCVRLAQEGARVAINYARNQAAAAEAERLVKAEGADCMTVQGDVADPVRSRPWSQTSRKPSGRSTCW